MNFAKKDFLPIFKLYIQKIGTALSGMIMPIIGVIVAWGLLTAFFIPTGWTPVAVIEKYVVGNLIVWLIPLLIGFLGGKQVYGLRGGFFGAAAVAGAIAGAKMFESGTFWSPQNVNLGPQFLSAMIMGPFSAFCLKKIEKLWAGKIKPGFEMLIDNFTMGILGMGFILASFFVMPWISYGISIGLEKIINPLTKYKALPVTSLLIEPAKPLFLNNAINHGIFTPLGTKQVLEQGKSILFYIESNPGPGMGILLAYMLMDKKQRGSASSASVIHFFGGIHEVYFPFIIMRPILVIAAMAGGGVGVAVLQIFNAGAIAPASPGSVIALFTVSHNSALSYLGLALSILAATVTSFLISIFLIKFTKKRNLSATNIAEKLKNAKKYGKDMALQASGKIKNIIFACDAGMGSSAMGVGILKKFFKSHNLNINVKNVAIRDLSRENPDLIVVQKSLSARAKQANNAKQYVVNNFLDNAQYENLVQSLKTKASSNLQVKDKREHKVKIKNLVNDKLITINPQIKTSKAAIDLAGKMLSKAKKVDEEYILAMHRRNKDVSVYIGNGVAIPHGDSDSKQFIKNDGLSIATYPQGIKWGLETVYLVIGIAAKENMHMNIISEIGSKLVDKELIIKLKNAKTKKAIMQLLDE